MISLLSSNLVFIVAGAIIIIALLYSLRFLFPNLRKAHVTISPSTGLGLDIETFAQENSILSIGVTRALKMPISPDIQRLLNLMVRYGTETLIAKKSFILPFKGHYKALRVLEKSSTYPLDVFAIEDTKRKFVTCERLGFISNDRDCEITEDNKVYLSHLASQLNKLSQGTSSLGIDFIIIFFGVRYSNYAVQDFLKDKFGKNIYLYFEDAVEADEQLFQEEINVLYSMKETGKLSDFVGKTK